MFVRKYLSVRARAGTSQLICYVNHLTHYCMLRGFAGGVSQQICLVISEQFWQIFCKYLFYCWFNLNAAELSKSSNVSFCIYTEHRSSPPEVFLGKGVSTLLKLHFGMDVLLYICCIFSEYLFVRTPLKGCFLEYIFKSKFLN